MKHGAGPQYYPAAASKPKCLSLHFDSPLHRNMTILGIFSVNRRLFKISSDQFTSTFKLPSDWPYNSEQPSTSVHTSPRRYPTGHVPSDFQHNHDEINTILPKTYPHSLSHSSPLQALTESGCGESDRFLPHKRRLISRNPRPTFPQPHPNREMSNPVKVLVTGFGVRHTLMLLPVQPLIPPTAIPRHHYQSIMGNRASFTSLNRWC